MILINLDRKSGTPIYTQIVQQIQDLIERGTIQSGTNLPSSRNLAEKLGVNRSTVYKAYQELWALGYIDSEPGSYSKVRRKQKIATDTIKKSSGVIDWEEVSTPSSREIHKAFLNFVPEPVPENASLLDDLSKLSMDDRLYPLEDLRRCMNQVMLREGPKILGYCEKQGYRPLREYIAKRLQVHGISTSADEILITNGSQNGIELILKLLTVPGSKVAIESPTYAVSLPLMKYYQIENISIPMKEDGLCLEHMEKALKEHKLSFLYTIPNFQNPTGITTPQCHREKLLNLCEQYKVPIVEDGFEEEMKYYGKVALPIKSMDKNQIVFYLGTFSKVLIPGIRLGWIAAESNCIERLCAIKRFCDLSSNSLTQGMLYEFCKHGYYDLHIKKMHRIFRKRMLTALDSLKKFMPAENVTWIEPVGGYTIWCHLKNIDIDSNQLKTILMKKGIIISPGYYYFKDRETDGNYFRISIAMIDEDQIAKGIRKLGNALKELYQEK